MSGRWRCGATRKPTSAEVQALREMLLATDEVVVTTGFMLQELLQGFAGPKAQAQIVERFAALALIQPDREDHVAAAQLRNACRRAGVQIGTVDCALAVWPARAGEPRSW